MSGERGDGELTYEKAGLFGLFLAEFALLLDDQVKETLCQHMLAPEELMRVESLCKFKVALEICTKNIYDRRKMSARDQITCLNFRELPLA